VNAPCWQRQGRQRQRRGERTPSCGRQGYERAKNRAHEHHREEKSQSSLRRKGYRDLVGGRGGINGSHIRALANAPDEGVDLEGLDVVELADGLLDLALVGLGVDDEDEGVVLLDLLHGRLGVQGVNDGAESVHAGERVDGLALVLGSTRKGEGLGTEGVGS
jgi:hypothetical protein